MQRTRMICAPLAAAYLVFIASVTLTPKPYDDGMSDVVRGLLDLFASTVATRWITFDVLEFSANVAMFVPLGALIALLLPARRRLVAAVICLAVSGGIELAQLLFLPSRVADVRDLVSNGLGGLIGSTLVLLVATAVVRSRRARTVTPSRRRSTVRAR